MNRSSNDLTIYLHERRELAIDKNPIPYRYLPLFSAHIRFLASPARTPYTKEQALVSMINDRHGRETFWCLN